MPKSATPFLSIATRILVRAVSVVATDSMTADALGTTLFVLGPEAGLRFVETWTNAAALFIVRESEDRYRQIPSQRFPVKAPEN